MKKIIILISTVLIFILICYGLSVNKRAAENKDKALFSTKEVTKIEIKELKYRDAGNIKEEYTDKTWELTDKDIIDRFVGGLNDKTKMEGCLDIEPPNYSLKFTYADKSSDEYDFWLSDKVRVRGTIAKGDSWWAISADSNSVFKEILK